MPERKITLYLLNPAHPVGGSKAAFFLRFGFTVGEWQKLAEALIRHAQLNEVTETEETRHGRRHAVDGPLAAPDGTILNVRSAWYVYPGSGAPRFALGSFIPGPRPPGYAWVPTSRPDTVR